MCQIRRDASTESLIQINAGGYLGFRRDFNEQFIPGWRLGKGNVGAVYTAIRRADGKKLAVKCISKIPETPNASQQELTHHLRLVKLEIEILRKLRGMSGILQIETVYEDATKIYLITELCKGGALSQRRSGKFNEKETARYMRGCFQALAACHAAGIIHRDVKPENFLLAGRDKRSELKLIDFGIGAVVGPDTQLPVQDLAHPVGTLFYMAPECTRAEWYYASDIWAAGIMAAKMLTGDFPFTDARQPDDPDSRRVFKSIRQDELSFTGPQWSKLTPNAVHFVRSLLVKDPAMRPTAAEALGHPFLSETLDNPSAASSLTSSMVSTPNISIDPDELQSILASQGIPFGSSGGTGGVDASSLAKRLQEFPLTSMSTAGSSSCTHDSSSFVSSPNMSLEPSAGLSDEVTSGLVLMAPGTPKSFVSAVSYSPSSSPATTTAGATPGSGGKKAGRRSLFKRLFSSFGRSTSGENGGKDKQ